MTVSPRYRAHRWGSQSRSQAPWPHSQRCCTHSWYPLLEEVPLRDLENTEEEQVRSPLGQKACSGSEDTLVCPQSCPQGSTSQNKSSQTHPGKGSLHQELGRTQRGQGDHHAGEALSSIREGAQTPGPGETRPGMKTGDAQARLCVQIVTQMVTASMSVMTKKEEQPQPPRPRAPESSELNTLTGLQENSYVSRL